MSHSFSIVTSRAFGVEELERFLGPLLPGYRAVVTRSGEGVPGPFPAVWVEVSDTSDLDWPCHLSFVTFPPESPLGKHPDLRLAEHLSARLGVRSLCAPDGVVPGLDPHDPYWSLAREADGWYLASTVGTPLMGPYTDGTRAFLGDGKVRLKHRVSVPGEHHSESHE